MQNIVILTRFVINNNEIKDLTILLSAHKLCKQMKKMSTHNIYV